MCYHGSTIDAPRTEAEARMEAEAQARVVIESRLRALESELGKLRGEG
jgi:hypothetical protein